MKELKLHGGRLETNQGEINIQFGIGNSLVIPDGEAVMLRLAANEGVMKLTVFRDAIAVVTEIVAGRVDFPEGEGNE